MHSHGLYHAVSCISSTSVSPFLYSLSWLVSCNVLYRNHYIKSFLDAFSWFVSCSVMYLDHLFKPFLLFIIMVSILQCHVSQTLHYVFPACILRANFLVSCSVLCLNHFILFFLYAFSWLVSCNVMYLNHFLEAFMMHSHG
jgi:hypothetical protein